VAHSAGPANVADESLHGREFALHVDEDRTIGSVRDTPDHPVSMGRLRHSRSVVYALNAS